MPAFTSSSRMAIREFYGLTTAEAETHGSFGRRTNRRPRAPAGGVGRSIGDACALAQASRAAGASALMVHQPPDPFVSPRGVVDYVERIADAGDGLPLMLYLRNDGIGLETIEELCRVPGVAGVKWARPTPLRLAEAIRRTVATSSGSAASPRPGRRLYVPSERAASPPA